MRKLKLFKTLLVAAGLAVGASNAWADKTYTTVYSNDYETASTISDILSGDYKDCQITDGTNHYLKVRENGRNGGSKTMTFPTYTDYDEFILSFKVGFYTSNSKASSFQLRSGSTTLATFGWTGWSSDVVSYTIGSTAQSQTLAATYQSNGTRASDTSNSISKWYTFTISGNKTDGKVSLTVNDGTNDVISNSEISSSYVTVSSLYFTLGNAHAEIGFDDMLLRAYSANDVVSDPSIAITGVNGDNRTVTITAGTSSQGNTVTTYYTLDGNDPTSESSVYSDPLSITSDCTVKAISITSSGKSNVTSLAVTTGAVTLAAPSWTKSSYASASGVSKLVLSSNQSSVLLNPTASITYSIDGGSETTVASGSEVEITDGSTIEFWAVSTGYTKSSTVTLTATAPNTYPEIWSETYNGIVSANSNFSLGSDATEINSTNFYTLYYAEGAEKLSDNLLGSEVPTSGAAYSMLRANGIYFPVSVSLAVVGLKKGDYIIFNGIKGNKDFGISAPYNMTADVFNSVEGSKYCYTVDDDGDVSFTYSAQGYLQNIVVKRNLSEAELAILDCKQYETSSAFATAVAAETFASAAEVYAFHTQWQIAQADAASSNDITKVIFDAAVSDFTRWNNARNNKDQQYTGAPDNKYFDAWDSEASDAKQKIYGLPAGTYTLKVATRASDDVTDKSKYNVWVSGGSASVSVLGNHIGNVGGSLGNGWNWTILSFTLDAEADVEIGFYSCPPTNLWAGCDDWHLYKGMLEENVSVTVSAAGYATFVSPYALDFTSANIKPYTVTVGTKGIATLTPKTQVPSNTPVLLYKEGGATENIPVIAAADALGDNDLKAGTGAAVATTEGDYTNMILNNGSDGIGFYFAADQTVAANRAYLHIATSLAPDEVTGARMTMVFVDETQGISAVGASESKAEGYYNLSGQRVAQPTKGLYIVNGKKVIIK